MDRACLPGGDDTAALKCSGASRSCNGRTAVVRGCTQFRIRARGLDLLGLSRDGRNMALACRGLLLRGRTRRDTAIATVVADSGYGIVHDRGVVRVVDDVDVHVVDGAVVIEAPVVPTAAFVAVAEVAIAVVDSTVEAHNRPPVAWGKEESVTTPRPITGSPVIARFRRQHPRAGHPEVSDVVAPIPIAGGPDVVRARTFRLVINGKIRRSEVT